MPIPFAASVAAPRSPSSAAAMVGSAIAGSFLLAIAAHVAVPFWPVPLTLQTFVVLLLGAMLGPVWGAVAVLAWIGEGLAGLPVFAGGVGPATLMGPTGGYIVGYVAASVVIGTAFRRGWLRSIPTAVLAFLLAEAVLFAAGVVWLTVLFGWHRAIAGGLTPFLLGEALKIGLATAAVTLLAGRLPERT